MCWRNDISAVINHRINANSHEGHYSLLAGIDKHSVRLNDPLLGPAIELDRESFLKLWLPNSKASEISGNVLIAIARPEIQPAVWSHCNQIFEDSVVCLNCNHDVSLKPAQALGCTQSQCKRRLWWRIFCPNCDYPIQSITSDS